MSTEATWREALEVAAEFLMDHGVITTGPELEQVCEQIRNLTAPKGNHRIMVTVSEIEVMHMNAPRDTIIGLLRSRGIPAIPSPSFALPTEFGTSIRVEYGRIRHQYDVASCVHKFYWDEGVPF